MRDNLALLVQEKQELITAIKNLETQKKAIEQNEKAMREQLLEAMERHGVVGFSLDGLDVQYIEPTIRKSIDSKKLRERYEEIARECEKITPVKASIRVSVKEKA